MPRTGPRRPLLGVKVAEEEIALLDELAEKAGVNRSDVARAGIAMALRGVDEQAMLDYLAAAREAGEPPQFTPEWRARLMTSQAVVGEQSRRVGQEISRTKSPRP